MKTHLRGRLLAVLLILVMLISMMPAAFAEGNPAAPEASETPETSEPATEPAPPAVESIGEINLDGPKAPVTGEAVPVYAPEADEGYIVSSRWLKGEQAVTETEFAAETEYTLAVTLTADETHEFAEEIEVTFDGEAVVLTATERAAGKLSFVKTYPMTEAPKPEPVARIIRDGSNVDFETFDEAFKAAKDGEEILLLTSCDTEAGINLDRNITISAAEGLEAKPVLNFTKYGIALWSKSITFNNIDITMNGIGSTPYYQEWYRSTICADIGSALSFNGVNIMMDGQGLDKHAIYASNGLQLNLNGSSLTIKNYGQDALEWNGGKADYNINMVNSHYISDRNCSGFTGKWNVKAQNSTVDVINSSGNGSNGSNFDFDNCTVNFNNNGAHGLSTGLLKVTNGTKVNACENGLYGVYVSGELYVDGASSLTVTGNAKSGTGGGMRIQAGGLDSLIESGAVVKINNNHRNGLENYRPTTIEEGVDLELMNNYETNRGGGLFSKADISLPTNAKIYNNHAGKGGDDICLTDGSITLGNVGSDWALDGTEGTNDCLENIDGWYDDSVENRWNAHSLETLHVEAVEAGTLNAPLTLKAAHGITDVEKHEPAAVSFVKVDSVTGEPISGAEFALYSDKALSTKLMDLVSDDNGRFTVSQLSGTYYLKETKAPEGYEMSDKVYTIVISEGKPVSEQKLDDTVTPNEVVNMLTYTAAGAVEGLKANEDGSFNIENKAVLKTWLRKVWVDNDDPKFRTKSVEIALYANKKEIDRFTLSEDNDWKVWLELPVYDENGRKINYSTMEFGPIKEYVTGYSPDGFTVYNTLKTLAPKTGDESNIWLWTGILLGSAAAASIAVFMVLKKKKNEQ